MSKLGRVLASHLIMTTYGFWLPNDPRGSGSDWVRKVELLKYGDAKKVTGQTRQSVARARHDASKRLEAKQALRFAPVELDAAQIAAVGRGFELAVQESGYEVYALAILRDHVHAVVKTHRHAPMQIMGHLKARATQQLLQENVHPWGLLQLEYDPLPSVWTSRGWKVFLFTDAEVRSRIGYVAKNLRWAGMEGQTWSFVRPFG